MFRIIVRPAVLKLVNNVKMEPKPFKFANFMVDKAEFESIVKEKWVSDMEGHNMYKISQKLKSLKKQFKKLAWSKGNLHDRVIKIRTELEAINVSVRLSQIV